jgi:SOUL heme-binding protein
MNGSIASSGISERALAITGARRRKAVIVNMIAIVLSAVLLLTGNAAMATEEPSFTVVIDDGAFQVRQYPALLVAETRVGGDRRDASGAGFNILAGYIFGGNTRRQKIAMTSPVVQSPPTSEKIAMTAPVSQTAEGNEWIVRFTMPSGYTMETLPKPNDPRVELSLTPAVRMAVIRFSGRANDQDFKRKRAELEQWMTKRRLKASGPASLAQYNPPWTLGPLRRNEVMVPIEATTAAD